MSLTDERKAEITALIDETMKEIQGATTIEELGLALENFSNSRGDDEKNEYDAKWVLKLFGRKFGRLAASAELSSARSSVYNMIRGALVGQVLISRLAQLDDLVVDPFDEFSDEE